MQQLPIKDWRTVPEANSKHVGATSALLSAMDAVSEMPRISPSGVSKDLMINENVTYASASRMSCARARIAQSFT